MFKIVVFLAVLSISLAMPTGDQEITMLNFFEPKPGEPTIQERHSVDATTVTMTLYTDSATCGGANTIKVSCTAGCTKKTTSFKSLKVRFKGNFEMCSPSRLDFRPWKRRNDCTRTWGVRRHSMQWKLSACKRYAGWLLSSWGC